MSEKPKYLYKYHQMNLHLMEMLTNAKFYMSKRSDLNDPLDSTFAISLESYLKLYYEKYPSLKSNKEHVELVSSIFKSEIERGESSWINTIDELYSKLRVSCFTEDGNNPLMWSHYAQNHTGVCLKFELSKDPNLEKAINPVSYIDEFIDINGAEDFRKCLLSKVKTWSVEKEWRIISEKERFPFKQEALIQIIFGLKVPDSTLTWFTQFRENVYYMHAPIYRLKVRKNKLILIDEWDEVVVDDL